MMGYSKARGTNRKIDTE